jgi:hypothetical protein
MSTRQRVSTVSSQGIFWKGRLTPTRSYVPEVRCERGVFPTTANPFCRRADDHVLVSHTGGHGAAVLTRVANASIAAINGER